MGQVTDTKSIFYAAGQAWEEAKALILPYQEKGEAIPDEVMASYRKAEADMEAKLSTARLQKKIDDRDTFFNDVDTGLRLPVQGDYTNEQARSLGVGQATPLHFAKGKEVPAWQQRQIERDVKAFNAALAEGRALASKNLGAAGGLPSLDTKVHSLTDADGGFLTPTIYLRQFVDLMYVWSFVRRAGARVIPMTSDIMKVPNLITGGTPGNIAAAPVVAESGAFTETSATIGEVTFTAIKVGHLTKASEEVVADSQFPLMETIIIPQFVQAFAVKENTEFTTGDGTGNAQGIITAVLTDASQILTAASATAIAGNDIIKLYHTLGVQYRIDPSCAWMANDSIIRDIRLLRDDTGGSGLGNYLWQPGLVRDGEDTILGKPVYANNSMDASAPASGEESLLFGAFQYYWIGERGGMELRVLNELYAGNGQVGFLGWKRFDGRCMNTEAFAVLQH